MVYTKECFNIPGYQYVKQYIQDNHNIDEFNHFLWSMDLDQATKYINNIFEDIHNEVKQNE